MNIVSFVAGRYSIIHGSACLTRQCRVFAHVKPGDVGRSSFRSPRRRFQGQHTSQFYVQAFVIKSRRSIGELGITNHSDKSGSGIMSGFTAFNAAPSAAPIRIPSRTNVQMEHQVVEAFADNPALVNSIGEFISKFEIVQQAEYLLIRFSIASQSSQRRLIIPKNSTTCLGYEISSKVRRCNN